MRWMICILATLMIAAAPATKPTSPATHPALALVKDFKRGTSWFSKRAHEYARRSDTPNQDGDEAVAHASQIEKSIIDHLRTNEVPQDRAKDMWNGKPKPGMSEEEIGMLGFVQVVSESTDEKIIRLLVWDAFPGTADQQESYAYRIRIRDGAVESVSRSIGN